MMARFIILAALCLCLFGCAKTTVVLLPEENGDVGQALVTPSGAAPHTLAEANQKIEVGSGVALGRMDEAALRAKFGASLAAFPPPPASFLIHFAHDSASPLPEARGLIPRIAADYAERTVPQVLVIGHTDSTGENDFNNRLSLKRARAVRRLLEKAGIAAKDVTVKAFGAQEPLVPTRPGVAEPRNRRVEVYIW